MSSLSLNRRRAFPTAESIHHIASQDSFCLQLIVLRAEQAKVRDIVVPTAREGFDVVDVQPDRRVATLTV